MLCFPTPSRQLNIDRCIIKELMKRSVRQSGVLKRLLFLNCRAWELAVGDNRFNCQLVMFITYNVIK